MLQAGQFASTVAYVPDFANCSDVGQPHDYATNRSSCIASCSMKLTSPTSTIGRASQRLMELEVDALMGAGYGEKSGARLAKRYGYREHD